MISDDTNNCKTSNFIKYLLLHFYFLTTWLTKHDPINSVKWWNKILAMIITCSLVQVCWSWVEICSSLWRSSLCPITFRYSRSIWMIYKKQNVSVNMKDVSLVTHNKIKWINYILNHFKCLDVFQYKIKLQLFTFCFWWLYK